MAVVRHFGRTYWMMLRLPVFWMWFVFISFWLTTPIFEGHGELFNWKVAGLALAWMFGVLPVLMTAEDWFRGRI